MATEAVNGPGCARKIDVRLAFKAENLQRVGAFKMRGATNAIQTHLERYQSKDKHFRPENLWVVTHSSGNHAAAVACAAASVGARSAVVMPRTAPAVKKAAVAGYGARIVECEPTQAERERTADMLIEELRASDAKNVVQFIHPYDEDLVIAGQGTLGLEILEQAEALQGRRGCSEASTVDEARTNDRVWNVRGSDREPIVDMVVAPVGGGGMLSGVSTAVKSIDERIIVIAAEPEKADDAARSFASGILQPAIVPPETICDGLLTALSPFTLAHVQRRVTDILTTSEADIIGATKLVWQRMKQIIEPSAAVGLAVVLNSDKLAQYVHKVADTKAQQLGLSLDEAIQIRIAVVWTGGNVELGSIAGMMASK
jgi:threonine dehydratase